MHGCQRIPREVKEQGCGISSPSTCSWVLGIEDVQLTHQNSVLLTVYLLYHEIFILFLRQGLSMIYTNGSKPGTDGNPPA